MDRIAMLHVDSIVALATTLVLSLESDPFYIALTANAEDRHGRRPLLHDYFLHALREAQQPEHATHTRMVWAADRRTGVALWELPLDAPTARTRRCEKLLFLSGHLGEAATRNYANMTEFMRAIAHKAVPSGAWYLSILGVHPNAQGTGVGRTLIEPTMAEADAASAACYLETFSAKSRAFYERNGFDVKATAYEPVTGHDYWLMLRKAPDTQFRSMPSERVEGHRGTCPVSVPTTPEIAAAGSLLQG
ncbi:MAG TPA: GNAT family N-acetyltransferase [Povalibacter sp.]